MTISTRSVAAAILLAGLGSMVAAESRQPRRPVHTYSIVARDPATGQLGVAVQSHWFSVGSIVSWAESGVGAVATQSFVDPAYGPGGLERMRGGESAPEALAALVAADEGREVRQVAMIDANGRVDAWTGANCIPAAGHQVGDNFSVQANLMGRETVWPAMAAAFEESDGDLAERLLRAMEAAEAEGGDIRGRQSAAILVVRGEPSGEAWRDRLFDLRVDDHPDALGELRRLVTLQRAYRHMNAGDVALETGDREAALREYGAARALVPGHHEMTFWHAVALVNMERVEDALPLFAFAFSDENDWRELVRRLPAVGLLPDDPALLGRIAAVEPAPR